MPRFKKRNPNLNPNSLISNVLAYVLLCYEIIVMKTECANTLAMSEIMAYLKTGVQQSN